MPGNHPTLVCPQCGAVTPVSERHAAGPPPKDGAVSVCIPCGAINIFGSDWSLRRPTDEEWERELRDATTQQMIRYAATERKLNAEGR